MIRKLLLSSLCILVLGTEGAYAFCTCWDGIRWPAKTPDKSDSSGVHCGGGIDWDTAILSYGTCKAICEKYFPGFDRAYVDQIAFNKCKAQYENNSLPSKLVKPTEEQKKLVNDAFNQELLIGIPLGATVFGILFGAHKEIIDKIKDKE